MNEVRTWSDTVIDEPMPVVAGSIVIHERHSLRDSAHDLKVGLDIDELDTIPAELLELFK